MLTAMQLLADGMLTPDQLILLASFVALIFVIRRWRMITLQKRKDATRGGAGPAAGEAAGRPALSVREVSVQLQALLAEVEETSRRLTAQLDNRYTRLEQLLAEADERIRRLETLVGADKHQAAAPEGLAAPAMAARVISEAERTLQRLRQERGAPAAVDDPAYQPIYSLADRGKTSREIAQELGRQPGEIELILALRGTAMAQG
jgi:hypothetical protein